MPKKLSPSSVDPLTGRIIEATKRPTKKIHRPIVVIEKLVLLRLDEILILKFDENITGIRILLTNERIVIAQEEVGIFFHNICNFKNISITNNEITFCFVPFIRICIRGRVTPFLTAIWKEINEAIIAAISNLYFSYSKQKIEPKDYESKVIRSFRKYYRQSDEETLYFEMIQRMAVLNIFCSNKEMWRSYSKFVPHTPVTYKRAFESVINTFEKSGKTSLVYRCTNESVILRRGIIKSAEQRIQEDLIVRRLISCMDPKKSDPYKRIVPFIFIASNSQKSEKLPNNAQYNNYHVIKVPFEDIIDCLSTRNAGHYINNMDHHVVEYTTVFKAIIKAALHIVLLSHCKFTVVIIENNELLDLSFLLAPLSKLIMDPYYTTIQGFIFLIRREFLNYHYNFSSMFDISDNTYERRRLNTYFLFLMTVRYFIFVVPSAFEFNDCFLEAIMGYSCSCIQFPFLIPKHYEGSELTKHSLSSALSLESYYTYNKFEDDILNLIYKDREYYYTKPNKEKLTILSEYFYTSSLSSDRLSIHTDIFDACLFQQWIYIYTKRIPLAATAYYSSAKENNKSNNNSDPTKPIYKYLYKFLGLNVSVYSEIVLRPDGVSDFSSVIAKEYHY